MLVELKGIGELLCHLPDTVYELKEDGSSLIVTVVLVTMTDTLHSQEKIEILSRNWKHSTVQVLNLPVGTCGRTISTPSQPKPIHTHKHSASDSQINLSPMSGGYAL